MLGFLTYVYHDALFRECKDIISHEDLTFMVHCHTEFRNGFLFFRKQSEHHRLSLWHSYPFQFWVPVIPVTDASGLPGIHEPAVGFVLQPEGGLDVTGSAACPAPANHAMAATQRNTFCCSKLQGSNQWHGNRKLWRRQLQHCEGILIETEESYRQSTREFYVI